MELHISNTLAVIWGSHSSENISCGLLGFNAVWSSRQLLLLQRNILPPSPRTLVTAYITRKPRLTMLYRVSGRISTNNKMIYFLN
jgi:hypothetical protein